MHKEQHLPSAVLYILAATLCFACMGIFSKEVGDQVSIYTQLFCRFLINLLFLTPAIFTRFRYLCTIDTRRHLFLLIVRNFAGIASIGCTFYAIHKLTVTDAIVLNNTSALFVPLVVWIVLSVTTPLRVAMGSVIGFFGVLLVLGPTGEIFHPVSLIGLASGLLSAVALVMVREISKSISTERVLFHYVVMGTILFSCFLPFENGGPWPLQTWLFLLGLGFSGALYQVFLTHALSLSPVRILSSLSYMSIIFSAILEWFIWQKRLDWIEMAGIFLVIAGGLTVILFRKHVIRK